MKGDITKVVAEEIKDKQVSEEVAEVYLALTRPDLYKIIKNKNDGSYSDLLSHLENIEKEMPAGGVREHFPPAFIQEVYKNAEINKKGGLYKKSQSCG